MTEIPAPTEPQKHREYLARPFAIPTDAQECFSESELQLLRKYGTWLDALMRKYLAPVTAAQEHFVGMCDGQFEPTTEMEHVWRRYRCEELYKHALTITSTWRYHELYRLSRMGHEAAKREIRSTVIKTYDFPLTPSRQLLPVEYARIRTKQTFQGVLPGSFGGGKRR